MKVKTNKTNTEVKNNALITILSKLIHFSYDETLRCLSPLASTTSRRPKSGHEGWTPSTREQVLQQLGCPGRWLPD